MARGRWPGPLHSRDSMRSPSRAYSAGFHCIVSLLAVAGSLVGWRLWFTAGGWERRAHWGEGALWATCAVIGLWAGIDAMRLGRGTWPASLVGVASQIYGMLLCIFHVLSLLLFLMFLGMLAEGGPGR
jgi:hypothetical protein